MHHPAGSPPSQSGDGIRAGSEPTAPQPAGGGTYSAKRTRPRASSLFRLASEAEWSSCRGWRARRANLSASQRPAVGTVSVENSEKLSVWGLPAAADRQAPTRQPKYRFQFWEILPAFRCQAVTVSESCMARPAPSKDMRHTSTCRKPAAAATNLQSGLLLARSPTDAFPDAKSDIKVDNTPLAGSHRHWSETECLLLSGGGGGIRTHGDLRHTRFPSVPIRPLSHPSGS